jgi:hypothetical protein
MPASLTFATNWRLLLAIPPPVCYTVTLYSSGPTESSATVLCIASGRQRSLETFPALDICLYIHFNPTPITSDALCCPLSPNSSVPTTGHCTTA